MDNEFIFRINMLIKSINEISVKINNNTNLAIFNNNGGYDNKFIILIYNEKPNLNLYPLPPDKCFYVNLYNKDEQVIEELKKMEFNLNSLYNSKINNEKSSNHVNLNNDLYSDKNNKIKYKVILFNVKISIKELFLNLFFKIKLKKQKPDCLYISDNIDGAINFILNKIKKEQKYSKFILESTGWWVQNDWHLGIEPFDSNTNELCKIAYTKDNEEINISNKIYQDSIRLANYD